MRMNRFYSPQSARERIRVPERDEELQLRRLFGEAVEVEAAEASAREEREHERAHDAMAIVGGSGLT